MVQREAAAADSEAGPSDQTRKGYFCVASQHLSVFEIRYKKALADKMRVIAEQIDTGESNE